MDRNEAASVIQRFLTCRDICRNECYGYCETCRYNTEYAEETEALKLAIKALGKDTNVPAKWIPVSERLPKEEGDYLVTDEAAGMAEILVDKYIRSDDGTWVWLYSHNAIAWMPLPEPWKGE